MDCSATRCVLDGRARVDILHSGEDNSTSPSKTGSKSQFRKNSSSRNSKTTRTNAVKVFVQLVRIPHQIRSTRSIKFSLAQYNTEPSMILELDRYGLLHQIGEYSEGIAMIWLTREPGAPQDEGQVIEIPAWILPEGAGYDGARFVFDFKFHESKPQRPVPTDTGMSTFVAESDRKPSKGECWFDISIVDASTKFAEKTKGDLALRFEDVPDPLRDEDASCYLAATIQYDHEQALKGILSAPTIRDLRFGSERPPNVGRSDDAAMVATAADVWAFDGEVVALAEDAATIALDPVDADAAFPTMTVTYPAERLPYYGRFEGAYFETYAAVDPDLEALEGDEAHPASNRTTFSITDERKSDGDTRFSLRWKNSAEVSGTLIVPDDGVPSSLVDSADERHLSLSLEYDRDATPTAAEVDAIELWNRYGH